jgi:hypothetical protein
VSTQLGQRPGGRALSRDTLSFLGGWGLMIYEAVKASPFNTTVFLGGMVIAGIPGAAQVLALWFTARTGGPPSDSPLPVPSSPSGT